MLAALRMAALSSRLRPLHASLSLYHFHNVLLAAARVKRTYSPTPEPLTDFCVPRMQFSSMASNEPIEYGWVDGVESLEMYEPGGYHPLKINDLLHQRYQIVDKLGYGGYSTIWLAYDDQLKRFVAVKVAVSGHSSIQHEIDTIRALSGPASNLRHAKLIPDTHESIPSVLDHFSIRGPNGMHTCTTFAPAQGNLREASFSRLFPIEVARALAAKLVLAVAFVHSRGFVHGDIHLRNILIRLPSRLDELSIAQFREMYGQPETVPIVRVDGKPLTSNVPSEAVVPLYLGKRAPEFTLDDARALILSDFGESYAPDRQRRLGKDCNTPVAKRAPEAFFEPDNPLSYASGVWSLGLAIWEILGMKAIFSESEPPNEVIAEQIDVLGYQDFPKPWRIHWEMPITAKRSTEEKDMPHRPINKGRELWPPLDRAFEEFVQHYRRKRGTVGTFDETETRAILDLMRGMLKFRPEERLTVEEVLETEWMVKWALPQLKDK